MQGRDRRVQYLDTVVVLFLIATVLFVSPAVYLWTAPGAPWYLPYLLWLLVIALAARAWWRSRHEL